MAISPLILPTTDYSFTPVVPGGDKAVSSLSPLALPIRRYSFESAGMRASASITFSEESTLLAKGELKGSTDLTIAQTGSLVFGRIVGSTSLSFTASATYSSPLRAIESISFSASATPSALANILGSTDVEFRANASFIGKPLTRLSPLVLPTTRVDFGPSIQTSKGSTSFSFTNDATLTAKGVLGGTRIFGSTTINLFSPAFLWLIGTGELKGSASITFGESATLRSEGALLGSADIAFSAVANLRGGVTGLSAVSDIEFTNTGNLLGKGQLQGSTNIDFTPTGTVLGTGELKGATVIRFLNPGMLIAPIEGATSFAFTATGTLLPSESTSDKVRPDNVYVIGRRPENTKVKGRRSSNIAVGGRR